ncbi:MAG TPA: DUF4365 domain-containing protein, partial [Pyrinomonadaceae bacterium]|nr:DUF4365 domain-containing protein [Pyrinomonadaceae bacterium]
KTLKGHFGRVFTVTITPDGKQIISGSFDETIRIWDLDSGRCLKTLKGHTSAIWVATITPDGKQIISGSFDDTIRIWDLHSGRCIKTLEGHTAAVLAVTITPDGRQIISGSNDGTIRIWDLDSGHCLKTLEGHHGAVLTVTITPESKQIISGSTDRTISIWDFPELETSVSPSKLYTNAKVALIGDSGVGKTGLAIRLVEDKWKITDSTHGMNVWQLPLSDLDTTEMEREVWLWDFAGQPDYRLIHQLFMDETSLAVMVIDPQKENPLEPLAHWEKALSIAVKNPPPKLLVAGRCERGGVTISEAKLDQYCAKHGYEHFQNTSAKSGDGCNDLKDAIAKFIPWDKLPWTSTTTLFKSLKDAILRIKQEDITLIRFAELHQRLLLELKEEKIEEANLRAVVGLLGGQGLIKPFDFGDFILLRPEEINNYASVVVNEARENSDDIGCVSERNVLEANLTFPEDIKRLKKSDEQFLLREVVNIFVKRSLCISEDTPKGAQLIFPSYFKQERPEIPDHPNIFVTFTFSGVLDEIYSTLVVRLHHTDIFKKKELWKYAADFRTVPTNKKAGFLLSKKTEGEAEIKVYLEQDMAVEMQVYFIEFIHRHLLDKGQNVVRVRHYVCPHCGVSLDNERTQRRIDKGFNKIQCDDCDGAVVLNDVIEEFASEKIRQVLNKMDEQAENKQNNDNLERILVGHATAIVAEAGQIFREYTAFDKGLDGEIEFIDDNGNASGKRVYLQFQSGDPYLPGRQPDDKEVFDIKKEDIAYWQLQAYPVMLVVRTSDKRIRWMNVTEYLKEHGADTKQILFDGELFTAPNVAKMRDKLLSPKQSES